MKTKTHFAFRVDIWQGIWVVHDTGQQLAH
jgi:hypothetical protein